MFNREFYPTPPAVIDQMIDGLPLQGKKVWEPEGGAGHIVKALQAKGAEVIACETDMDLRKILQTKCTLIGTDMLLTRSEEISHVDYIVMNPPFNQGATHLLHAYHIAPPGCKIIALCNAETIKNPYSTSRQELVEIIATYGNKEDLGDCFSAAERKTGANVALVRIDKPGEANREFEGFFIDEEIEPQSNGLITYNAVRDLVNRYVAAVRIFDQQLQTAEQLNDICEGYFGQREIGMMVTKENRPLERNKFKKDMQKAGWHWIFSKLNMQKHSTRGLKEDINKFVETQENVPFTMRNIYKMLEIVIGTAGQRMDKAILEVFEKVTKHTHENRHNVEGWQTNSHYLLNRKFIMPDIVRSDWSSGMAASWNGWAEPIEDLQKALCYLTGDNYDDLETFSDSIKGKEYGKLHEWSYFKIRGYKKGTMHFEFKDEKLWAAFNARVAKLKGYPLYEHKKQTKWQEQRQGKHEDGPRAGKGKVLFEVKI